MSEQEKTHELVKKAYGDVARRKSSCCQPAQSCCPPQANAFSVADHPLPEADLGLSCGNPVELAALKPGEAVLDLGSGAGRDVFLAARAVGPGGRVIGVDMTPDMVALARANALKLAQRAGLANIEFREGLIEALPVEDASVDVVLSNCVINLSPDKAQVFREAFRVLKPGGRLVVSDIVLDAPLPEAVRQSEEYYAACLSGALPRGQYLRAIAAAGFSGVEVLKDAKYQVAQASGDPFTCGAAAELVGCAASITVVARKAE